MLSRIIFGEVVSMVIRAFILEYIKLLLCMPLTKQMIAHVSGFRMLLVYIIINKACGCRVIRFDKRWWL